MIKKFTDYLSTQIVILIVTAVFIFLFFIIVSKSFFHLGYEEMGQIGSTFGGLAGPIVTIITGALLYTSIQEQRKAFAEQTKSNEISILNQKFVVIVNEINNIENSKKDDLRHLDKIRNNIRTIEDKLMHDSDPEIDYDEEGVRFNKPKFIKLDSVDWLQLIAIVRKLELCFEETKNLEDYSKFPLSSIKRIYIVGGYSPIIRDISTKLGQTTSEKHKSEEEFFTKIVAKLRKYTKT